MGTGRLLGDVDPQRDKKLRYHRDWLKASKIGRRAFGRIFDDLGISPRVVLSFALVKP